MKKKLSVLAFLFILMHGKAQFSVCEDYNNTPELQSSLCVTLNVPLAYGTDMDETIELFVRKFPAQKERKGSIWLVAGGPGESGASLYPLVYQFAELFPDLDIFVPDHRGTGLSGKICPKEESVESVGGIALVGEEWGSCFGYMFSDQEYVKAFSITNAAKDLDYLINELSGEGKRYVYGVSYGTQLVLRLLQLGPLELDGVFLDSLVPLQDDMEYDLSHRSFVTHSVGQEVLEYYDRKAEKDTPSLSEQLKTIMNRSKADDAFAQNLPKQDISILLGMMLDLPTVRRKIPEIIRSLSKDDVGPLNSAIAEITTFYRDYGEKYSTSTNSIPLAQVITASENNPRPQLKKGEVVEESKGLIFTSPLPKLIAENTMPTYEHDSYFAGVPKKMPPTLIIHGSLDSKTHWEGAKRHIEKLSDKGSIEFVTVRNAPHFIALFAPDAFKEAVIGFLEGKSIAGNEVEDNNVALD